MTSTRIPRRRSIDDDVIPLRTALRGWGKISLQTFGGPAGQIAVMHRELVDDRKWIGERHFLHALNYCMLLPGPEAQQLSIYLGWLLNGWAGGLLAGVLFVLPGFLAILGLSVLYVSYGDTTVVTAVLVGIAPVIVAVIASAVHRVGRRALTDRGLIAIAAASFVATFALGVPFPLVVAGAAVLGFLFERSRAANVPADDVVEEAPDDSLVALSTRDTRPSIARALAVLAIGGLAWGLPIIALIILAPDSVFVDQSLFFSGTAVVTFGGAYAVLAYIARRAVDTYGWLRPGEMIHGLAMAESTPGPLIQVVQFVGFVGAYRNPGGLDPWVAAVAASILVTWVTYVPCFLWVFLGAPYIEALRANQKLSAALAGITAAVVGVIANLGLFFLLHTWFGATDTIHWSVLRVEVPDLPTIAWAAPPLTAVALWLLVRRDWSVLRVLGACGAAGAALHLIAPSALT